MLVEQAERCKDIPDYPKKDQYSSRVPGVVERIGKSRRMLNRWQLTPIYHPHAGQVVTEPLVIQTVCSFSKYQITRRLEDYFEL